MSDEPQPSSENINQETSGEVVSENVGVSVDKPSSILNPSPPSSSVGGRKYKSSQKSRRGRNKFYKKFNKKSLKKRKRSFRRKTPLFGW